MLKDAAFIDGRFIDLVAMAIINPRERDTQPS